MATKGEGKAKKGEKRSAKKLDDALTNIGQSETNQQEEVAVEQVDVPEVIEPPTQPKAPSPEPVYDEPVLSELIVERYCLHNLNTQIHSIMYVTLFHACT